MVIVYLAYLFVTIPMLWHRIRRNPAHAPESANFTLGRWGLPVNIVAVVFGIFLLINVGWPRAAVYDPAGQSWVLQYSAPLSVVVAIGLGIGAYAIMRRQRAAAADPQRPAGVSSRAGRALIFGAGEAYRGVGGNDGGTATR